MPTIRVHARVATTHALPAYGGIRLSEQAIHQMAEALADGQTRMTFQHDMARPVNPTNVEAGVETMEDGELAAWVEFDVDQEKWEVYEREKQAAGAPGGFSYATTQIFATRGDSPYDITISADAAHFDWQSLTQAAHESLPEDMSVELRELFQFSWAPDPKVMIEIGMALLTNTPTDLIEIYLIQLTEWLRGHLARSNESAVPTFELRVHRTPGTKTTEMKITSADGDSLAKAMQAVPEILRAEGESVTWDADANEWRKIS